MSGAPSEEPTPMETVTGGELATRTPVGRRSILPPVKRPRPEEMSSSAAAASSSTTQTSAAERAGINEELNKIKNPELQRHMSKTCQQLQNRIEGLQRVNDRIAVVKDHIIVLGADKIRSGCKPFNIGYDNILFGKTETDDLVFTCAIPSGMSVREAKRRISIEHMKAHKQLDLLVAQEQMQHAGRETTLAAFIEAVKSHPIDFSVWQDLDLDLDPMLDCHDAIDLDDLKERATRMYAKVFDKVGQLKRDKVEKEKMKEQSKNKIVEDLLKKTPAELFDQASPSTGSTSPRPKRS